MEAIADQGEKSSDAQRWLRWIAAGTALAAGAVIIAPYVLPALGVGSATLAEESMLALHGAGLGNGLAGAINGALNMLPGIGPTLAGGGWPAAAATGLIGIGGVLLGRYVDQHDDGTKSIRWGKVIKTAALMSSALIALPSLLTGLSAGIVFLCAALSGPALASAAVPLLKKTLGSIGTASMAVSGASGAALTLPHLLTCGSSIVPLCVSWLMGDGSSPPNPAIDAQIISSQPARMGEECELTLRLTHAGTGKPLSASELAVVHTQKLHLLVVDESLKDYRHIHPQPTGTEGEFTCRFTPGTHNRYSAWADFTTARDHRNYRLKMQVPSQGARGVAPVIRPNSQALQEDMTFYWRTDTPLQQGTQSQVEIDIRDARGEPVSGLEPVMGAYAHLVGFSADGKSIMHCHPLGEEPKGEGERGVSPLRFHLEPQAAGMAQFFLQVKKDGKEVFVPFGQEIGRQQGFSTRLQARSNGQNSHSHAH